MSQPITDYQRMKQLRERLAHAQLQVRLDIASLVRSVQAVKLVASMMRELQARQKKK